MDVEWLYFAGIGIFFGLFLREWRSKLLGNLIVGVVGAALGGWFLGWIDMFPYDHFMGAGAGAVVFVVIKQGATSISS